MKLRAFRMLLLSIGVTVGMIVWGGAYQDGIAGIGLRLELFARATAGALLILLGMIGLLRLGDPENQTEMAR